MGSEENLSKKQKTIIYIFVIIASVFLVSFITIDAIATGVNTDDMSYITLKSDSNYDDIYYDITIRLDDATHLDARRVNNALSKLPSYMIDQFIDDDGEIYVTSEHPNKYDPDGRDYEINGLEIHDTNKIYVWNSYTSTSDIYVWHEFGHYWDYKDHDNPLSDSLEFRELADKYYNLMCELWGTDSQDDTYAEVYAESFRIYFYNPEAFQGICPELYDFVEESLEI